MTETLEAVWTLRADLPARLDLHVQGVESTWHTPKCEHASRESGTRVDLPSNHWIEDIPRKAALASFRGTTRVDIDSGRLIFCCHCIIERI